MRAYIRPLGEPNRCINVYAAYDCSGNPTGSGHGPRWYRLAFRRMYILLHGGGRRRAIDRRLAEAGLRPLAVDVAGVPRAPIAVLWSTLPAGSPTVPQNRPRFFYPGDRYVDWVGTDFYSDNQDWKSLTGLYHRFSSKPFAIPEFGVSNGDDPGYVQHLMTWVKRHERCKMLIYYQDFGAESPYRIQNYPASLAVLDRRIHTKRFPAFAPGHPTPPPPPPGGVSPKH
jgi:Glycosyl hydrolase family 26